MELKQVSLWSTPLTYAHPSMCGKLSMRRWADRGNGALFKKILKHSEKVLSQIF